jgi:hypothetical protein
MKHFFSLLFILFFTLSAQATTCPADKPLQDIKGNCYSCDDPRTFIEPYQIIDDEYYIQQDFILYKNHCADVCPNRIEYNDGWMDADNFCVTNAPINKIKAYLMSNIMYILFNPLNWINFFLLIFVLSHIFTLIFKKYESKFLSISVKFLSIFCSLIVTLTFLNNFFRTLFGIISVIYTKITPKEKVKSTESSSKLFLHFIKIVFLILILLFLITGTLIFLGNNL